MSLFKLYFLLFGVLVANCALSVKDCEESQGDQEYKLESALEWFWKLFSKGRTPKLSINVNGAEPVTEACLRCICQASTGCKKGLKCTNDVCGPYQITKPYWIDAGKPTLPGVSPDAEDAYPSCTNDFKCAADTVRGYMKRLAEDCDGDGVINCYDYMAIHRLGGYGSCKKSRVPFEFANAFNKCVYQQW